MKISIETKNGIIIFLGIGIFFLLLDVVGLSDQNYLRLFNALIVIFGINQTLKFNYNNGKTDYLTNLFLGFKTGVIGVVLGIVALAIYIQIKGGETYMETLSDTFFFGGKTSIIQYCSVLLFEGIASSFIATFTLMQYWKGAVVKTN